MAKKNKEEKKKLGRPVKITNELVGKIEQGFKIGLNITECCVFVGINRDTLYEYIKKHPEFSDKIEEWKRNPIAKAKYTIYKNLDDPNVAKWLLERKDDEYSTKVKQEITNLTPQIIVANQQDADLIKEIQNVKPDENLL